MVLLAKIAIGRLIMHMDYDFRSLLLRFQV
jgi:hypothetical protein